MKLRKTGMIFKSSEGVHLKLDLKTTTLQLYYNLKSATLLKMIFF